MTSSVVKPSQMERVYQNFPDLPQAFPNVTNWPSMEEDIGDRNRSAFNHPEQWGEPLRLGTDAESVRKFLVHTGVSKSEPAPDDVHSARFYEIAAEMDQYARGLLWKISDCTFIPGPEVVEFAGDYDALRAIVLTVRAGWVKAAPGGLLVTQHGRGVAGWMFVDR